MDFTEIDSMVCSDDSSVRREAAVMLSETGGEESLDRLQRLLQDTNSGVRDAAQNSITILGGRYAIEKMVPLLSHEDPGIRNAAIDILRKIGEDGLEILHALSKDPNDNVRLFIIDILGSIGNLESVDTLINGLYDSLSNVRNAAVISLGTIADPKAFDHLKNLINDEEWVRFSVIEALGQIPHEDVVGFLLTELKRWKNDEITMCAILETLGSIKSKNAVSSLIEMLGDSDKYIEFYIVQTLLKIISTDDIASLEKKDSQLIKYILEENLVEADDDMQHLMLATLMRIGDTQSIVPITDLAKKIEPDAEPEKWADIKNALIGLGDVDSVIGLLDEKEKLKTLAAEILGRIGGEDQARELIKRLPSEDVYVKRSMTDAIANIGGPLCKKTLLTLMSDPDGHVASSSINAIGRLGDSKDIDELRKYLGHPYPDVRNITINAISNIGTNRAEDVFNELVYDNDPSNRIMGLKGLKMVESENITKAVIYMLRDQDPKARLYAAQIAKEAVTPIDNDLITALLTDENDNIRHLAIDIVGQRKIDTFRSYIEDAVSSTEMWTAHHAIEALGQFRDDQSRSKLLNILEEGPDFLKISVIKTLGEWGDESLADEIEIYMDHDNLDIARAAAEALDKLQGVSF